MLGTIDYTLCTTNLSAIYNRPKRFSVFIQRQRTAVLPTVLRTPILYVGVVFFFFLLIYSPRPCISLCACVYTRKELDAGFHNKPCTRRYVLYTRRTQITDVRLTSNGIICARSHPEKCVVHACIRITQQGGS